MLALRVAVAFALSAAASARQTLHVRETSGRWFGDNHDDMDEAYFAARDNTWPQLLQDDETDQSFFKNYYMFDKDNKLEELSLTNAATQPTEERQAAEDSKERNAIEALLPRVKAEEAEADYYYREVFPFDEDNDLEAWSYGNLSDATPRDSDFTNGTVDNRTLGGAASDGTMNDGSGKD